jgi:signal transduction histidine kinase
VHARHGLDELAALVTAYGPAAPPIHLAYQGERRALPEAVETAAYRIAQESLVNVLRHAAASRVDVVVEYRPDGLVLEVRDDGAGPPPDRASAGSGHGVRGMTERAVALGGWLSVGPVEGGTDGMPGFQVRAWLPTAGRS